MWDGGRQKVKSSEGKVEGRTSPCLTGGPRGVASPGWQRHRPSPQLCRTSRARCRPYTIASGMCWGECFGRYRCLPVPPLRQHSLQGYHTVCRTVDACRASSEGEAKCYTMAQHRHFTCRENPGVRWPIALPSPGQPILRRYGPCCSYGQGMLHVRFTEKCCHGLCSVLCLWKMSCWVTHIG